MYLSLMASFTCLKHIKWFFEISLETPQHHCEIRRRIPAHLLALLHDRCFTISRCLFLLSILERYTIMGDLNCLLLLRYSPKYVINVCREYCCNCNDGCRPNCSYSYRRLLHSKKAKER